MEDTGVLNTSVNYLNNWNTPSLGFISLESISRPYVN